MTKITYDHIPWPVREDILNAHRRQWLRLSEPGTWLTGRERLAIARELRNVDTCVFCTNRKNALSPLTILGTHDSLGLLPEVTVEQVHSIWSDPGRLSRSWYDDLIEKGLIVERYVETVGVIATVVAIDTFCTGLGIEPWPIPEALEGHPSRKRPAAKIQMAWVPTLTPQDVKETEYEWLFEGRQQIAHIYQAMTLVPEEVKGFFELVSSQYLPPKAMTDFDNEYRAISHSQIELIAGRMSALNQCVY